MLSHRLKLRLPLLVAALSVAGAASANYPATPDDLRGMASLVCSGVIVRANRGPDQPAVLLTNGHCATNASIDPDDALVDVPYSRGGDLGVYVGGDTPETMKPSRILYATRTGLDVALIELKVTYRELEAKGAKIYEMAKNDAKPGSDVQLVSGFWKEKNLCAVSHLVPSLVEDVWTTRDAYAMNDPCPTTGGWSGTPMVDPTSLEVVGILNSTNLAGQLCTLDNPCEVSSDGTRLAFNGRTYGQRVSPILNCLSTNGDVVLTQAGCGLTRPKPRPTTETKQPEPEPSPSPTSTAKPSSSWPKR
ncbi:MAG: trypsin-like peptidase domain-containing protein [Bdellovibrionales bacterium]|nr:trypsin-like peptidase domain-containing protein [Bdellovibrionales bacterium]